MAEGEQAGATALAARIESPRLQAFLAFWQGLQPAGGVPRYSDFDVIRVPRKLVPHLILLDVLDGGREFRYRVVGTGVVEAIGREFTGETVGQYHRRHESSGVKDGYVRAVCEGGPNLYRATLTNIGKDHVRYERVAAPLAAADGEPFKVLACFQFGPARRPDDPASA